MEKKKCTSWASFSCSQKSTPRALLLLANTQEGTMGVQMFRGTKPRPLPMHGRSCTQFKSVALFLPPILCVQLVPCLGLVHTLPYSFVLYNPPLSVTFWPHRATRSVRQPISFTPSFFVLLMNPGVPLDTRLKGTLAKVLNILIISTPIY